MSELDEALKRYWGYDSFRPMQERIVRSLLAGRDACVVMPTGGGKSLCYQLPAALRPQHMAVVVSPLIALMQDQVAQLTLMGIPAALLNSAVTQEQQSRIMREARAGKYRLLYLSPERLARADTIGWLQQAPLSLFAIDEAHCISEWGHEFRPEYRQLSALRQHFPNQPIAAFTASATRRVRHDILEQLQLHDPAKFIASFHRPNLRYVARVCESHQQPGMLERTLRHHADANVIVYAPTIARVEQTVDWLGGRGIAALAYHGKMDADLRRRNQERWMSDEVRVLVGTVAFGLGINKAAVRAVVHLSLPKSIEQYYQEAGRAGRDGEPADCLLLWQKRDAGLLAHFIEQVEDAGERERGWQRYHQIRNFAEAPKCRHHQICLHFGEQPKWERCAACDVCGYMPDWLAPAAETGRRSKRTPRAARTELELPAANSAATAAPAEPQAELRSYLREWRRQAAREAGVAAFLIMHDSSLDELSRRQPKTAAELLEVSGFGERKVAHYGVAILEALERFAAGARASSEPEKRLSPAEETLQLLAAGKSLDEIAAARGRQRSTVVNMVAELIEQGKTEWRPDWLVPELLAAVAAAVEQHGADRLKPLKEAVPQATYDDLRLAVAHLNLRPR